MTAISVMLDVAFHGGRSHIVSAADIAGRLGLARRGTEPLLQLLSRGDLLESIRGPRGGYRLARPAREISLDRIVAVATVCEAEGLAGPGGELQSCAIDPLWVEMERCIYGRLNKLSLSDLVRRAEEKGLRRPASEPITFVI